MRLYFGGLKGVRRLPRLNPPKAGRRAVFNWAPQLRDFISHFMNLPYSAGADYKDK